MPGWAGLPRRNEPGNEGVARRDTMRRGLRVGERGRVRFRVERRGQANSDVCAARDEPTPNYPGFS